MEKSQSLNDIFTVCVALGKTPKEVEEGFTPKQIGQFVQFLGTNSPGDAGTHKLLTDLLMTLYGMFSTDGNVKVHPADIAPWLYPGHKEMKAAAEKANRRIGVLAEVNSMMESGTLKIEYKDKNGSIQ